MRSLEILSENIGLLAATIGCIFILIASIGALRMPDLFTRMHASTKAASLGLSLCFIGTAIHFGSMDVAVKTLIGIAFVALTTPVGAHALARSFYFMNSKPCDETIIDEFEEAIQRKSRIQDKESKPGDLPVSPR